MFFRNKKTNGFTLIELLIVVVIIGVLAGMVFVMIQGVIESARMARNKSFARSIQLQLALNEVGVWRFDDDPADGVHDASGWGNHGTLHIGAAGCPAEEGGTWQEGVFGKAICFDGVDDFVRVSDPGLISLDLPNKLTIEVWINWAGGQPGQTGWHNVYRKVHNYGLWLHTTGNFAHFCSTINGVWTCLNSPYGEFPIGSWTHVVVTYDGERIIMYINGKRTPDDRYAPGIMTTNNEAFLMGHQWGVNWFKGLIDEPRIYNRALTVFEIQDRYVKGLESLLARGIIDQEEFNNRMAKIEKNLVAK